MSLDSRKLYITHCSAKKNPVFKESKDKVTPDKLYTATPIQRFINECKNKRVNWAIFSDKYGVWFSDDTHEWYDKNPSRVTEDEFGQLISEFDRSLCPKSKEPLELNRSFPLSRVMAPFFSSPTITY